MIGEYQQRCAARVCGGDVARHRDEFVDHLLGAEGLVLVAADGLFEHVGAVGMPSLSRREVTQHLPGIRIGRPFGGLAIEPFGLSLHRFRFIAYSLDPEVFHQPDRAARIIA